MLPARAEPAGSRLLETQIIESVNDTFKGRFDLEAGGARTVPAVLAPVRQHLLTLTAVTWYNVIIGAFAKRFLADYDH